jgi:hypothetical protein
MVSDPLRNLAPGARPRLVRWKSARAARRARLARGVLATVPGAQLVKRNVITKPVPPSDRGAPLATAIRQQVLVVEPDLLTEWSLRTYLGKWFSVHSANSMQSAERVLAVHAVDVLVVSDALSPSALTSLEERARRGGKRGTIVRMVTDPDAPPHHDHGEHCLEKPFALAQLARLLGVSEEQLPAE